MSFGDKIRAFFSRRSNPELNKLAAFALERKGVEGYIEPRTATSPTTLLLVDRDGDHARAPVREPADAAAFCDRLGIPLYDAQVIGYPKRMRDFERNRRAQGDSIDEKFAELERRFNEPDHDAPDN